MSSVRWPTASVEITGKIEHGPSAGTSNNGASSVGRHVGQRDEHRVAGARDPEQRPHAEDRFDPQDLRQLQLVAP